MGKEDGFSVGNAVGLSVGTPGTESRRRRCDIPGVESPYDSASAYEYENSKTSEKPAYESLGSSKLGQNEYENDLS